MLIIKRTKEINSTNFNNNNIINIGNMFGANLMKSKDKIFS